MRQQFDLLLDSEDDLQIINGDFVIGESLTQEVANILRLNQGELKFDPLLGPNMVSLINSNANAQEIETRVKLHLARDNKNFDEIKQLVTLRRSNNG
ncbi:hypothetical protein GFS24_10235 [Chitinophaga sp. SYP-B3965]|uniref:hypothetical protein n=1 Tax=Chitinophaga sp. SYP-B3965 TaxID=2663120 RepID=UPI00129973BA|nr:hypothetical protein [Chitinophaga sp. SYP-B3965]MRG45495.1 hypothetical protein [Chitinophaga sp. SYP-B3965]